ncbi:MAG: lipid-A-disaccharide synthase [Rudaea sp.]
MELPASKPLRVAIVAGEASGDQLGAELIRDLRAAAGDIEVVGVGGPSMRAAGLQAWHDCEELAVMGIAEVLRHLPRLLRLRKTLAERLAAWKPDVFVGIDAPDFNLGLERRLKERGIRTVHYVSPSVWAWREGRVKKIQASADLVLCLFPMEPAIYARHAAAARFVGHPLARMFPMQPDQAGARAALKLPPSGRLVALLPGSRLSEIARLGAIFVAASIRLRRMLPDLRFVAPMANARCRGAFEKLLDNPMPANVDRAANAPTADEWRGFRECLTLTDGQAHTVMSACDLLLLASGTAALEGLLAKRPMVVSYRVSGLTYVIVKGLGLLKIDRYSLPNILSGQDLVPELMQADCTAERIADALRAWLQSPARVDAVLPQFAAIHQSLIGEPGAAAAAVLAMARGQVSS